MKNVDKITEIKNGIIFLENELIDKIFEYIKTGKFNLKQITLSTSYDMIQRLVDASNRNAEELFIYYNQIIENYISDCCNNLSNEPKKNLIDGFLFHTKNIYYLIYWMNRIFYYLCRYYTIAYHGTSLSTNAMDLYESIFYKKFEDNILDEINNLKKEEKYGNKESSDKIQAINKIFQDLKLQIPKITKEKNEIQWVEDKTYKPEFLEILKNRKK